MAAPSILLLDDDPMLRQATASMLTRRGANVSVAHRLEEAVEFADARAFEVAIVDLSSPASTVSEALRALRGALHAPRRFLVCTEPDPSLGCDDSVDVLHKPFDFERLVTLALGWPVRRRRSRSGVFPSLDASLQRRAKYN
jgi:DNA-binding response OmpR family regulator